MFKSYLFVMRMLRPPAPPLCDAVPALFESLLSLFAPRRFVFAIDHGELRYLTRGERGHWNGEEVTGEALTECPPGEGGELIEELHDELTKVRPTHLWVGAEGALYHHAPSTPAPAWYGRWRLQRSLSELIEPSFAWTEDEQAVEVRLPLSGYPLTSIKLRGRPEGDRVIDDGDAAAAAANRALIGEALSRVPAALGLARSEVRWELHGDTHVLAARYPTDAAAVRELLHRL
jgi:hypothetical protein